jgi:hypothetical protein
MSRLAPRCPEFSWPVDTARLNIERLQHLCRHDAAVAVDVFWRQSGLDRMTKPYFALSSGEVVESIFAGELRPSLSTRERARS